MKRNQNQYQPASGSWEARASELNNMSAGAMPQEETAGNGALGCDMAAKGVKDIAKRATLGWQESMGGGRKRYH